MRALALCCSLKAGGLATLLGLAAFLSAACRAATPGAAGPDVAPVLSAFSAAPSALVAGRPTTVIWSWAFAAAPSPAPTCSIAPGVGEVSPGDSTRLTLSADTTYTLTCSSRAGSASRQIVVAAGADLLPSDRLPPPGTWESAGVEGGIPVRSALCATVTDPPYGADPTGAANAAAAIQRAIDDCPAGKVVSVPAGTYRIDDTLVIRKGIALRGAGRSTVFRVAFGGPAVRIGSLGPWPPPKANPTYRAPVVAGASRGSTRVTIADASPIAVGDLVMIDEEDDPALVWTKPVSPGRYRASTHLVEAKGPASVTFRPPLPVDFTRSPQISWIQGPTTEAGVERITFLGTGVQPGAFVDIQAAWNCWVLDCEFSNMPSRTIFVAWSGHVELRRIHMHDQSNGGPNSEGIDLFCDVNWSLVVDSVCVAGGFPQINIGDGGANPYYSGGFGNVIAYNYAVDAFYTDPPTAPDAGKMPSDVGTNHSPHSQYNLVEGNVLGKFGSDAYHGSGSHTVLLRNRIFGASRWPGVSNPTAVQIDRRNLFYAVVGNVLGLAARPAALQYATASGWSGSAIFRLGFPDGGNDGYQGTFPPTPLLHGDGGPRDLYVDRDSVAPGTTLVEGNWDSASGRVDWSRGPQPIPESLFLPGKPAWFGSLAWPPVDPERPASDDPAIIPAGYRAVHGVDPPP